MTGRIVGWGNSAPLNAVPLRLYLLRFVPCLALALAWLACWVGITADVMDLTTKPSCTT